MNALLDTYAFLAAAMLDDPLLCLANAVAWLDPLWELGDDEDVYEEGDGVGLALCVTRSAFPDIYAGVVERLRAGASYHDLDRFICAEITERGIPLDSLEFMGYGIPLTACGVELSNPESYDAHPDLLPLLALFGIQPEPGCYSVEVPEGAYTAGRILADSLMKQADERLQQVGWALAWLFSCSGNSLIDFDDDSLAEIPPLTWEADEVAFAIELIQEAEAILQDVTIGLERIATIPLVLSALSENAQRIYRRLRKGKKPQLILFVWPAFE